MDVHAYCKFNIPYTSSSNKNHGFSVELLRILRIRKKNKVGESFETIYGGLFFSIIKHLNTTLHAIFTQRRSLLSYIVIHVCDTRWGHHVRADLEQQQGLLSPYNSNICLPLSWSHWGLGSDTLLFLLFPVRKYKKYIIINLHSTQKIVRQTSKWCLITGQRLAWWLKTPNLLCCHEWNKYETHPCPRIILRGGRRHFRANLRVENT